MSPALEVTIKSATSADIDRIKVTNNVRKHFDEKHLQELAENIKKVGILQPLIVRAIGKNGSTAYELVAGERRLRAAKLAGLDVVPVTVRELTDEEALEIQAFENLHRKDLGPIEEARAFKMLTDAGNHDVKALAARVDKSEAYVYRSLRLLELPDAVLDAIEEGKMTPAHGHQLLRAPEKRREGIAKSAIQQRMHAGDLQEAIDRELGHDLAKTEFPKDRPYGGMPACIGCPLNSDNQVDLLGEVTKGRCTGADCFKRKVDAYVVQFQQEQKAKLPGVKFGPVVQREYNANTPPGMVQLPASAAVLALVKKEPEAFRAAVIKEREWNDTRPGLVIFGRATKEVRKAAGMDSQGSGSSRGGAESNAERPSLTKAIAELATAATRRSKYEKLPKLPTADQIRAAMREDSDDDSICQILQITPDQFKAFDQQQMIKAVFFAYCELGYGFGGQVDESDQKHLKEVRAAAAGVWPKSESPACKVCGCKPMSACKMAKDGWRTCWWVKPGLCSACQAQGKDIPVAAAPAAKSKGKKKA